MIHRVCTKSLVHALQPEGVEHNANLGRKKGELFLGFGNFGYYTYKFHSQ
jgi:hypothetical protein